MDVTPSLELSWKEWWVVVNVYWLLWYVGIILDTGFIKVYLKWINFRVDKISRIEDRKFSRGFNFANQPVFHLISFIFLGVLAKIAILKNFAWTKFRENGQNTRKSRKLIRANINPLKVFHLSWESSLLPCGNDSQGNSSNYAEMVSTS